MPQEQTEANPIDDMDNVENNDETQLEEDSSKQIDCACCMLKAGLVLLTIYAILLIVVIYVSIRITLDI